MSIITTIRAFLLTDTTLTGIISTRLYYQNAPQEVIKPYVVYIVPSDPNRKTNIGKDGGNPSFSFQIVATTMTQLEAISEAIRAKIIDYTGLISGTKIYWIEAQNIRDIPKESDVDYYERYCDYEVNYER